MEKRCVFNKSTLKIVIGRGNCRIEIKCGLIYFNNDRKKKQEALEVKFQLIMFFIPQNVIKDVQIRDDNSTVQ